MADQEHIGLWPRTFDPVVISTVTLETTHCAEPVGTNGPLNTGHEKMGQTGTDTLDSIEILPPAVAVIPDAQLVACDVLLDLGIHPRLVRAEPSTHLKPQALYPFVLYLGERLEVDVSRETPLLAKARKAIVALADRGVDHVETESAGAQRPVVPVKANAIAEPAGVKAVIAGEKVVFKLRS